jgi:hypothetical protein
VRLTRDVHNRRVESLLRSLDGRRLEEVFPSNDLEIRSLTGDLKDSMVSGPVEGRSGIAHMVALPVESSNVYPPSIQRALHLLG